MIVLFVDGSNARYPKGIVVALLVNLQGVTDIGEFGKQIALQLYETFYDGDDHLYLE